jgi:tetratricopeptide (TPR) repeat protein
LGYLDEALDVVEPFSDGRRMPEWLYWGRVRETFVAAGEIDKAVEASERAAELAPDNPTILIDLAATLLRYRGDTARAQELLYRAKAHAISDMLANFVLLTEAVLTFEQGKASLAIEKLEQAQAGLNAYRNATPLVGAIIDRNHAYLALAHAKVGDTDEAERHYRLAEPRLRALKADDLIQRCEKALHL